MGLGAVPHCQMKLKIYAFPLKQRYFIRDVNEMESLESRSFFSIPGKEFFDFRESRLATA